MQLISRFSILGAHAYWVGSTTKELQMR